MAISSSNNSDIQRNQIEQMINTVPNQTGGAGVFPLLPYDPQNAPDEDTDIQVIAPNSLDNSDFDFSKDGYVNSPTVGGDPSFEAYNFYRNRFIQITDLVSTATSTAVSSAAGPFKAAFTYPMNFVLLNGGASNAALSGTLTRVDDNNATLSTAATNGLNPGVMWIGDALGETSAKSLKAAGHSLFAANEGTNTKIPRWDQTNGWCEFGTDTDDFWDIQCPLPINLVRGGLVFYFSLIMTQRSGTGKGDAVRLFCGIWDATAGRDRFLESGVFTVSGAAVPPPGGSTTYRYKIIADLDNGTSVESAVLTITTGPVALSGSTYNRLTWENATGILRFKIYRDDGVTVKRIFTITNGAHDYNDYGTDEGETLLAFPSAESRRPLAYAVSPTFNPRDVGLWQRVLIKLEIPGTYDTSTTTGKQWLRFGLEGQAGSERMLLGDRVMLSTSNGGWTRSSRDMNKILNQNPTSLPIHTSQGNTGVGVNCFTLDTPIIVCNKDGSNFRKILIGEADRGMYVFSGATRPNLIVDIKDGQSIIIICILSNGVAFRCSPSERFITSRADRRGTRIDDLTIGDRILCWEAARVNSATIEEYAISYTKEPVRTLSLKGGKTFVAGSAMNEMWGAIAHNLKPSLPDVS